MRWRALWQLILDAWPAWLPLVGFAVAAIVGFGTAATLSAGTLSARVRHTGTVLETLGLFTVAVGLWQVRQQFGRDSSAGKRSWFKRLVRVFRRPEPIILEAAGGALGLSGGHARLKVGVGPAATVDQRLKVLEQIVEQLEKELDSRIQDLEKRIGKLAEDLTRESQERNAAAKRIGKQIEDYAVGGLRLEVVGLVWLVLGLLGANIPDEIAAGLAFVF